MISFLKTAALILLALGLFAPPLQAQDKTASLQKLAKTLEANLSQAADPAAQLTRIGLLYLRLKDKKKATQAFERALKTNPNLALAHIGLGRVRLDLEDNPKKALSHFEAAVEADSTADEAYKLQVETYLKLNNTGGRVRRLTQKVREIYPDFAPAYLLSARYYQESGGSAQATIFYYKEYLRRNSRDQDAAYEFALTLMAEERFKELEDITARMTDPRALPLLAQAQIKRLDFEGAQATFQRYISALEKEEKPLYDDISLVGTRAESRAYRLITLEKQRQQFLKRFWLQKDPFKTTGGAMRRCEHYRRVWYARTHYGKKWPWDKRGEVYIRWGEPQFRSTSKALNVQPPQKVQFIQEAMAYQLYREAGVDQTFAGPVFPIRTQRDANAGRPGDESIGLESYKPVTATGSSWSSVPWEAWYYTNLENGIELTFTDEFLSGNYDYAPIPALSEADMQKFQQQGDSYMRMVTLLNEFAPETKVQSLATTQPEYFHVQAFEPLEFYFEWLAFRGENGKVDLQINFGLDIEQLARPTDVDTSIVVELRTSLVFPRATNVVKTRDFAKIPIQDQHRGRHVVVLKRVDHTVNPGEYQLAVQALRVNTNHTGVYQKPRLVLPNFNTQRLMMSDIQIARQITEAGGATDSTFIRGNWNIRPAPSAIFGPGKPLFVYFEIYNLSRDEFGQTRYRVAYEFQRQDPEGFSIVSLIGKLGEKKAETVGGSFEQTGTDPTVSDYLSFDLPNLQTGRYNLKLTVTDLNSEQTDFKTGIFKIPGG